MFQRVAASTTSTFNFDWKREQTFDETACLLVVASRRVHQLVRKLQEWESLLNVFRIHVEMPRGGQLSKTCAPEPPAGRFPKFLLPRAAGRTQKLKFDLCIPSPMPVRVVGGEWKPAGFQVEPRFFRSSYGRLVRTRSNNWRQGHRK